MAYTQKGLLDRSLTDAEERQFREYAQQTDPPDLAKWDLYHPVCREEWIKRGIYAPVVVPRGAERRDATEQNEAGSGQGSLGGDLERPVKSRATRASCECADSGCPVHPGSVLCQNPTVYGAILYRVDMEDRTGTRFCGPCAADAMDSGLFR